MKKGKKTLILFGTYLVLAVLLIGGFTLVTGIVSKESIKENVYKSGVFYSDKDYYQAIIPGLQAVCTDYYSDATLLNIIYSMDSKHPFKSVIKSEYAFSSTDYSGETLAKHASTGMDINVEYNRYWHGTGLFLRPLLVIFDITQIYILNAIIMAILIGIILFLLLKAKERNLALAFIVALAMTRMWTAPYCIQFTTMTLLMLVTFLTVLLMFRKKVDGICYDILWLSIGVITPFIDFLTVETLPFMVAIFVYMYLYQKKLGYKSFKEAFSYFALSGIKWLIGYSLMWSSKWIMVEVIANGNSMDATMSQAGFRLFGGAEGYTFFGQLFINILDNVGKLDPFVYFKDASRIIAAVVIFAVFVLVFLFRKSDRKFDFWKIGLLLGLIPFVRFLVLANHTFYHTFFTYRALFVTVMALTIFFREGTIRKGSGKKCK